MSDKYFIATNICLYAFNGDMRKKDIAVILLSENAVVSTQVQNR
jgi:predicted nucleic acid-binding protein